VHSRINTIGRLAPTVARNVHRISSSAADVLPSTLVSKLNRLPAADVMLIGPRTSRILIDVQHPDRPRDLRVDVLTMRTVAEALVDEVALSFLKGNQAAKARSHFEAAHFDATRLARAIEAGEIGDTPERFCVRPDAPVAVARPGTVRFRGTEAAHLTFPSGFRVPDAMPGAEAWDACRANKAAHVFVVGHHDDAPWLVNVHGVRQGTPSDLFLFRSGSLRDRFGINVVHPVLPMSGPRSDHNSPQLPGLDLCANVIGLAQAVWDVRRTIRWIRQRSDAPIILHGVSLGSHVASLVAGLEDDLAAVIAGLPVTDYPALMRRHAQRMNLPERDLHLAEDPAIDLLHSPVSPLRVGNRVRADRRYIYAGKLDQISSTHQALALWEHWGAPSIHWFGGGHVGGALWDRGVKRYIDAAVAETLDAEPALA